MEKFTTLLWRAMLILFVAFVVLAFLQLTYLVRLPDLVVFAPVIAAVLLLVGLFILDMIIFAGGLSLRARLQAIRFGLNFHPFDWQWGDKSPLSHSSTTVYAIGPLWIGWRLRP